MKTALLEAGLSQSWQDPLTLGLAFSLVLLLIINLRLFQALQSSSQLPSALPSKPAAPLPPGGLAVVVPAYNEALNVTDCLTHLLDSSPDPVQVWLVDDESTDDTWTLAQAVAEQRQDPRLHLLSAQPRPAGWVGKNWACTQAMTHMQQEGRLPEWVLFQDCDVRLYPGAINALWQEAEKRQVGLLSVLPRIRCGCMPEWLVQPLMMAILAAGYDFKAVNNPDNAQAFAAGPLMLFRRTAYEQIGGHAAVAHQVVEDVELARRIKQSGLGLMILASGSWADMRMYADGSSLWEGWTKNWFLGLGRNWGLAAIAVLGIVWVSVVPWLGLAGAGLALEFPKMVGDRLAGNPELAWLWFGLSGLGIAGQIGIRWQLQQQAGLPLRYWWLTAVGGLITASMVIASGYRTTTGQGWTWRGRALASQDNRQGALD